MAEFKKLGFQNPTLSTNAISTLYNSKWNAQGFFLSSVSSSQFTKSGKALPYNVCFSPLSSTPQNPAIVNCRTEEDANADSGYSATTDWLYENSDDDVEPDYTTFDAAATAAAASPSSFNVTNDASSPPGASHYLDVMLWKNQNIIIPSHIKKEVEYVLRLLRCFPVSASLMHSKFYAARFVHCVRASTVWLCATQFSSALCTTRGL